MPDISLFPAICNLFDVTADHLLGIDIAQKEAKIDEMCERADGYASRGYYDEAYTILKEGLRELPNSCKLMRDLMYVTFHQGKNDEAIALGEKILAGCTEDWIRQSAIQILCYCYRNKGERERALELACTMPNMAISREMLVASVETGDDLLHAIQLRDQYLYRFLVREMGHNCPLDSGELAYTLEECAADAAIRFLEDYASAPGEFVYTSLLFRGLPGGCFSTSSQNNDAAQTLAALEDTVFDLLREDASFRAIAERLTPYAGKWTV